MTTLLRPLLVCYLGLAALTGLVYPLAVTGLAALTMPRQAQGSLIERRGAVVGSALIGQSFSSPRYFWGRPSATTPQAYNGAASAASNLGPTNPALRTGIAKQLAGLGATAGSGAVPIDLVTASASGLDPHISPAAAQFQAARVAAARGLPRERVQALIATHTEGRTLGLLGEPRVNVLLLNLALDDGG